MYFSAVYIIVSLSLASSTVCVSVFILHLQCKHWVSPPPSWILYKITGHVQDTTQTFNSRPLAEDENKHKSELQWKDQMICDLQCINSSLQDIKMVYSKADASIGQQSGIKNQWKTIANKVDKMFFYIFLCLQLLATLILIAMICK